jgi:hypothetical protein
LGVNIDVILISYRFDIDLIFTSAGVGIPRLRVRLWLQPWVDIYFLGEKMVIVEPGRPKNTENQRY